MSNESRDSLRDQILKSLASSNVLGANLKVTFKSTGDDTEADSRGRVTQYARTQTNKTRRRTGQTSKVGQTSHRPGVHCAADECPCGSFEQAEADEIRTSATAATEMLTHNVPGKRQTKKSGKLTKGTSASFNTGALRGVPGGGLRGGYQIMRMIEAEATGTRVLEDLTEDERKAYEVRLSRSSRNCNTTTSSHEAHRLGNINKTS